MRSARCDPKTTYACPTPGRGPSAEGAVPGAPTITSASPSLFTSPAAATDWPSIAPVFAPVMTNPADPDRPNNLWEPVPGDHGAHGVFGQRSTDRSVQLWLTTHRKLIAAAGVALGGAALYAMCGTAAHSNGHEKNGRLIGVKKLFTQKHGRSQDHATKA